MTAESFEIHGGNVKATYETAVGWNWENGTELANEYATIRMDKGAVFTLPNDAYLKLYNGGRLCYIGDARFYFEGKGKYYCADKDCKYTNTTNYRGAGVGRKDGWRTITNKKAGGNWNDNRGTCTGKTKMRLLPNKTPCLTQGVLCYANNICATSQRLSPPYCRR